MYTIDHCAVNAQPPGKQETPQTGRISFLTFIRLNRFGRSERAWKGRSSSIGEIELERLRVMKVKRYFVDLELLLVLRWS